MENLELQKLLTGCMNTLPLEEVNRLTKIKNRTDLQNSLHVNLAVRLLISYEINLPINRIVLSRDRFGRLPGYYLIVFKLFIPLCVLKKNITRSFCYIFFEMN